MRILIGIDGSEHSDDAVGLIANFCFSPESKIYLVHVAPLIELDASKLQDENAKKTIEKFNHDLIKHSETLLIKAKNTLAQHNLACETKIIKGYPVEELCLFAKKENIDLIAVGSRGVNPLKNFFLGSVSDAVMRQASCSVLIYHHVKNKEILNVDSKTPLNIVIGYDDSQSAKNACAFVKKHLVKYSKHIELVAALQLQAYYGINYPLVVLENMPDLREKLEKHLEDMKLSFGKIRGAPATSWQILDEITDAADELIRHAKANHKDMIVIGHKGKNAFDRFLLGSVSTRLAHHADIPVLIAR